MASQFLGTVSSTTPDKLLSFNNNELMKFCESQACSNARNLIAAIGKVAERCCGVNVPVSPETMSTIFDQYLTQFSQCFKDEYNLKHSPRPRVLRSVSENEVFEPSAFGSTSGYDGEALENIAEAGYGVAYNDNENKFSSVFPNIPKSTRRRMSADDIAVASSLKSMPPDYQNQKSKKNRRSIKRGISFHGSVQHTKNDGRETGSDNSTKGLVSSVINRLRRASYSRQGKVSSYLTTVLKLETYAAILDIYILLNKPGVCKLWLAGRMQLERSFYAACRHLQKLYLLILFNTLHDKIFVKLFCKYLTLLLERVPFSPVRLMQGFLTRRHASPAKV